MIFMILGAVFVTAAIASDIAGDALRNETQIITVKRYGTNKNTLRR